MKVYNLDISKPVTLVRSPLGKDFVALQIFTDEEDFAINMNAKFLAGIATMMLAFSKGLGHENDCKVQYTDLNKAENM